MFLTRLLVGFQVRRVWKTEAQAAELVKRLQAEGLIQDGPDWLAAHDVIIDYLQEGKK